MNDAERKTIINWIGVVVTICILAMAYHHFKTGKEENALQNIATACLTTFAAAWQNMIGKTKGQGQEQEAYGLGTLVPVAPGVSHIPVPSPDEPLTDPVGNPIGLRKKRLISPEDALET